MNLCQSIGETPNAPSAPAAPRRPVGISEQSNIYPWFAVVIRSNQGEVASTALQNLGYEQFQPTRTVRRQWSDRVKVIQEPLFPGYLFCRFDPQDRLLILTARVFSKWSGKGGVGPKSRGQRRRYRAFLAHG